MARASPIEKQFELNMHSSDQIWSNSYDQVNLKLARQVGVKCMLFMDEIESKVNMHSSDLVNSNQVKSKHAFK